MYMTFSKGYFDLNKKKEPLYKQALVFIIKMVMLLIICLILSINDFDLPGDKKVNHETAQSTQFEYPYISR